MEKKYQLSGSRFFLTWFTLLFIWLLIAGVIANAISGYYYNQNFFTLQGTLFQFGIFLLVAIFNWPMFSKKGKEQILLSDEQLIGPISFSTNSSHNNIDLTNDYKIVKTIVTFPFRTVMITQLDKKVCLSSMFLPPNTMNEILDNLQ